MLKPIETSYNLDAARTRPVVVVYNIMLGAWPKMPTDVDIQPITRADFVPAKVFRSRSMNTLTVRLAIQTPFAWRDVILQ